MKCHGYTIVEAPLVTSHVTSARIERINSSHRYKTNGDGSFQHDPLDPRRIDYRYSMVGTVSSNLKYNKDTDSVISFAGGCFWGTERLFKEFLNKGVVDLRVGYANGTKAPETLSYEEVCKGDTDFAEIVQVSYDKANPDILRTLVQFFFKVHDPTTVNLQGHDQGTQYRSAIFYHDESQVGVINEVIAEYNPKWDNKIVTVVEKIEKYYDAEDYHQNYFESELHAERGWPACETHFVRDI